MDKKAELILILNLLKKLLAKKGWKTRDFDFHYCVNVN